MRKIASNNDPGDSTHWGGDDTDYINKYLTGVDQSAADPVTIATTTKYNNAKLQLSNPLGTFQYIFNTSNIGRQTALFLPALTADDTIVCANALQYIAGYEAAPDITKVMTMRVHGANSASLSGLLAAHTIVGAGSLTSIYDTTEGMTLQCSTASTANQNTGVVSPTAGIGIGRSLTNIHIKARQKVSTTGTNIRFYFGFTSANTLPISDTPLANTDHGVLIGYRSTDTVWQVFNNDATGAMVVTPFTGSIATDTAFHTIDMTLAAGGGTATIFLDNGSATLGTRIPLTTASLYFNSVAQSTTTTAISQTIRYIRGNVDR